jgi:hypothetical protein
LTLTFNPLAQLVKITIFGLVISPGFFAFLNSGNIGCLQIRLAESAKKIMSAAYLNSDPYTICIERKYCFDNYGLLYKPVYLALLLVGHFF